MTVRVIANRDKPRAHLLSVSALQDPHAYRAVTYGPSVAAEGGPQLCPFNWGFGPYNARMSAPTIIVVRPNASLSPHQARALLVGMCLVSFTIAGIFTALDYWIILPFAGLEMGALALGLCWALRDNAFREVLRVVDDTLYIEYGRGKPENCVRFPLHWAQIKLIPATSSTQHCRIEVQCSGRRLEIGKVLPEDEREAFSKHLRDWLQHARCRSNNS